MVAFFGKAFCIVFQGTLLETLPESKQNLIMLTSLPKGF